MTRFTKHRDENGRLVVVDHGLNADSPQSYIPLRIFPETVEDTKLEEEWEAELFVKEYYLKDQREPPSYNQEGRGLEYHYKYIKRLRMPGLLAIKIWDELFF